MNKAKYLFDDCVSHRNTLKINKKLRKFFDDLEDEFYKNYKESDTSLTATSLIIDNWDDVYQYPSAEWKRHSIDRDIRIELKPRMIHYEGYLYRYMSIDEYNKYISHSLEDSNKDWHNINPCSDNKGYCFIGQDYRYLNAWDLDMEHKYLSLHEKYQHSCNDSDHTDPIEQCLLHVGMVHDSFISRGCINSKEHVTMQNVLCKFYYKGEIRQSVGYYGEGCNDDWEDNYMIEYGLPNYNNLTFINARFSVYNTVLYK